MDNDELYHQITFNFHALNLCQMTAKITAAKIRPTNPIPTDEALMESYEVAKRIDKIVFEDLAEQAEQGEVK